MLNDKKDYDIDIDDMDDIVKEQKDEVKKEDKEAYQKIFEEVNDLAERYFSSANESDSNETLKGKIEKILYDNCTLIMRVAKINGGFQFLKEDQTETQKILLTEVVQKVFKKREFNPYRQKFSDYLARELSEEIKRYRKEDLYEKRSAQINELAKEYFSPEDDKYRNESLKLQIMTLLFESQESVLEKVKVGKGFYNYLEVRWREDIYIDTMLNIFDKMSFDTSKNNDFMMYYKYRFEGYLKNYLIDKGPTEFRIFVTILEDNVYLLKDADENSEKADLNPLKVYSNQRTKSRKEYQVTSRQIKEDRIWYKIRFERTVDGNKEYHSGWVNSDKVNFIRFENISINKDSEDEEGGEIGIEEIISDGSKTDDNIGLDNISAEILLNLLALVNNFNSSIKNNESKQLYDRLFYTEKLIQLLHTNDNEIDTLKDHERDIITATEEEWLDYLLSEKRKCRSLRDIMITRAKYYEELREMISGECGLPDHAEIFFNEKEEKKEKNKKKYNADQYELNIPIKPSEFIIYEMFFKINNCIINYEKNVLIGYRRSFQGLINQLQKGSA